MSKIADGSNRAGGMFSAHGITGLLAIILMIVHAVWATVVLIKKSENASKHFHKFSLAGVGNLADSLCAWHGYGNEVKIDKTFITQYTMYYKVL